MRGEKNTFRVFAWKKTGTSLIQIAQNVFLTVLFSFFLSISAGQICWGRRIQRSCLCWRRRCSSSGGCGRAWTQVRRSAGRASLSSGQPAAWSRPGGHPSWRMPCRKVRQANRVFIMYLLKVLSHTDENYVDYIWVFRFDWVVTLKNECNFWCKISGPHYNNQLPIAFRAPACTCPFNLTQYLCLTSLPLHPTLLPNNVKKTSRQTQCLSFTLLPCRVPSSPYRKMAVRKT